MKYNFKHIMSALALLVATGCKSTGGENMNVSNIKSSAEMKNIYELSIKSLDGTKDIKLSEFKGKKILFVNVASECGYTKQYEDLQKLHEKFKDNLVLIGLPCNQFGGQEPGSAEEIQTFCKKNYGVTFLLTEKIEVKGDKQHPIYQWLTKETENGKGNYEVGWNFNKFLVNENGELMAYFGSRTKPLDTELVSLIEKK